MNQEERVSDPVVLVDEPRPLVRRLTLTHPDAEGILRCFHFDAALARYQSRMQTFFRAGAGLVFLLLMTGLALIVRRRR